MVILTNIFLISILISIIVFIIKTNSEEFETKRNESYNRMKNHLNDIKRY